MDTTIAAQNDSIAKDFDKAADEEMLIGWKEINERSDKSIDKLGLGNPSPAVIVRRDNRSVQIELDRRLRPSDGGDFARAGVSRQTS